MAKIIKTTVKVSRDEFSLTHRFLLYFDFIARIFVGDFILSRWRYRGTLNPSSC